MLYIAHIFNPYCKASIIKDIMLDKVDKVITAVKRYFKEEQLKTVCTGTSIGTSLISLQLQPLAALLDTQPVDMSVARQKAIQNKRAQDIALGTTLLISKLDCQLVSEPKDQDSKDSPDFVQNWWKEHALQQPHLAKAACDILPCSASEVDVERLFSGCRDKLGI